MDQEIRAASENTRLIIGRGKRRDGRYIEQIGTYDPMLEGVNYTLDLEKADKWIGDGAQPSVTVKSIIKKARKIADAATEA